MKGRLDVDRLTPQHTGWRQGPAIPMLGAAMDERMDEWTVDTRLDECMDEWTHGPRAMVRVRQIAARAGCRQRALPGGARLAKLVFREESVPAPKRQRVFRKWGEILRGQLKSPQVSL